MPSGMASKGENINHYNGIRLRVLGTGELNIRFLSMPDFNDVQTERVLVPLDLDAMNQTREPLKKVNFMQQRSQVELKTTEFGAFVRINRLVVFAKPVFTNYPG